MAESEKLLFLVKHEKRKPRQFIQYLQGLSKFFVLLLIFLHIPYLFNLVSIAGENILNQIKWQRYGSQSYSIQTDLKDFSPFSGVNTVTVQNGEIIKVETDPHNRFGKTVELTQLKDYSNVTIEGMFQTAYACSFQPIKNYWLSKFEDKPYDIRHYWLSCDFKYDPMYGYPNWVYTDCPNKDYCSLEINVLEVKILTDN